MTIAAILSAWQGTVISVECDTPVRDAVARLAEHNIGAMPVIRDGEVVGIMSERDIIHHLSTDGAAILDWTVAQVMTAPAITVEPGLNVLAALSQMTRKRIRHLPVLEGDRLVGIVSIGDLVKYRIDRIEAEATAMREYIQGA